MFTICKVYCKHPITLSNLNLQHKECLCVWSCCCVRLFATVWTIAHQAPLSMGFSRQEYWSGLPFASPGDIPNPGIEPRSPALQADALSSEPPGKPCRQYCLQIEKAREFQKNIFCFTDYAKAFDCVYHNKLWKILRKMVKSLEIKWGVHWMKGNRQWWQSWPSSFKSPLELS